MFEINSKYEYSEQLKTTYKLKYDTDNSNLTALHQFILAFLKSSQFVDEENNTNYEVINEFVEYLSIIVNTNDAEPYEALFYYEINRALGNDSIIEEWFEKYPEYVEHCKICVMIF